MESPGLGTRLLVRAFHKGEIGIIVSGGCTASVVGFCQRRKSRQSLPLSNLGRGIFCVVLVFRQRRAVAFSLRPPTAGHLPVWPLNALAISEGMSLVMVI